MMNMCALLLRGYICLIYSVYALILCKIIEAEGGRLQQHANTEIIQMNSNLRDIPPGNENVALLNVGYNELSELSSLIFHNNNYTNVKKLMLQNNRIANVSLDAFRFLNELRMIDLSHNKLPTIDSYVFRHNDKLDKVILIKNHIKFNRLEPFLMSHTIETLILTQNEISEVYETTFLGLTNLKRLYLNGNKLRQIAQMSFERLTKLTYLSLADTEVYDLQENMFSKKPPRTIDIEDTPLAKMFTPPLSRIRGDSIQQLFETLRKF